MFSSPIPEKIDYFLIGRGMAAIGVLLSHEFSIGAYSIGSYIAEGHTGSFQQMGPQLDSIKWILYFIIPILGRNFVIMFFVQSGYLMGKVFFDQKYMILPQDIVKFYRNRLLRIVPLLYFNLLVGAALYMGASPSFTTLIGDLLFITNFTNRGINLVTWSLSHEVQYYLICPFVFFLFRKLSIQNFMYCIAVSIALFAVTRHEIQIDPGLPTNKFLGHFSYVYVFICGFSVNILIRIIRWKISEKIKIFATLVGVALVNCLYNFFFLFGMINFAEISVVVVSAAMVFFAETPSTYEITEKYRVPRMAAHFWMLTGILTYGIYLWHYMVVNVQVNVASRIVNLMDLSYRWENIVLFHAINLTVVLIFTYALAWTTFHLVELRFRPGLYGVNGKSHISVSGLSRG